MKPPLSLIFHIKLWANALYYWTDKYRNLLFFRCRNIFGRRSPSEILLREYFFIITHAHTHVHAKRTQRWGTSIFLLLLPEQDQPRMSNLRYFKPPLPLYERESFNAHLSPPLSCFTPNFFELEIFSDNAARPKIKSHENLSNENFANEKRQITVCLVFPVLIPRHRAINMFLESYSRKWLESIEDHTPTALCNELLDHQDYLVSQKSSSLPPNHQDPLTQVIKVTNLFNCCLFPVFPFWMTSW